MVAITSALTWYEIQWGQSHHRFRTGKWLTCSWLQQEFLKTRKNYPHRNFTSRTFSFVWETLHVRAYGHWKNLRIMENLGHHGNISLIPRQTARFTSARTHSSQSKRTMTSFVQQNSARSFHWKPVKLSCDFWTLDHRQTTTSTRQFCRNGLVPQTSVFVCSEPRICSVIWCRSLDKIQR